MCHSAQKKIDMENWKFFFRQQKRDCFPTGSKVAFYGCDIFVCITKMHPCSFFTVVHGEKYLRRNPKNRAKNRKKQIAEQHKVCYNSFQSSRVTRW